MREEKIERKEGGLTYEPGSAYPVDHELDETGAKWLAGLAVVSMIVISGIGYGVWKLFS